MVLESREQFEASVSGAITAKTPGEPDWCWQMVSRLQYLWKCVDVELDLYLNAWASAEVHRIWEKIPPDAPYGSKDAMLKDLEFGDGSAARARVAAHASMPQTLQRRGSDRSNGKQPESTKVAYGSSDYWRTRIARDHPEIHARMKNGEFKTVTDAARAAGIYRERPKDVRLGKDVGRVAANIKKHYSGDQVKSLIKALQALQRDIDQDSES